jgi:hypothetical protein
LLIATGGYLTDKRAEFIQFINGVALGKKIILVKKDQPNNDGGKFKRRVSPNSTSVSLKKTKGPGWSLSEVSLARVIIDFVYNKLEVIVSHIECKEKEKEERDCVEMALDLTKRKTYEQIIKGIKENVCRIFNYTEIGMLFYDPHGKKLHFLTKFII